MDIEFSLNTLINQLPTLAVTIAIIWTRLHYMEKKIDSIKDGFFRCRDHDKLEKRTIENLKRWESDTTN